MTTSTPAGVPASRAERALLHAAGHADQRAQDELLRRYEPLVQATLRRMTLPPRADREDLAQEARLALVNAIRAWRPGVGAFPALAQRCIANHLIMTLRYAGRTKRRAFEHALSLNVPVCGATDAVTLLERIPSAVGDPEHCALVSAQLAAILEGLPKLTERERNAMRGALNDYTQKQLAARHNTTSKAIQLLEARARRKLARDPLFTTA